MICYEQGDNILIYAVKQLDIDTIKRILNDDDSDIDIDHQNVNGKTALMCATEVYGGDEKQHEEILTLLLSYGADVNILNEKNETILDLYSDWVYGDEFSEDYMKIIDKIVNNLDKEMIDNRPDYTADDSGNTPLMKACNTGSITLINYLLKKGANINIKNNKGYTALELIPRTEIKKVIDELIDYHKGPKLFMDKKCAICLDDFDIDNDELKLLKCGHVFHDNCHKKLTDITCPTCRN